MANIRIKNLKNELMVATTGYYVPVDSAVDGTKKMGLSAVVSTGTAQTITAAKTFSGGLTVSNSSGFNYSGIATGSDNVTRPIWFSDSSVTGKPVINANQLSFNPGTKVLKVGDTTSSTVSFGDKVKLQWNSTTASLDFNFV